MDVHEVHEVDRHHLRVVCGLLRRSLGKVRHARSPIRIERLWRSENDVLPCFGSGSEFPEISIVPGPSDICNRMPTWMTAVLRYVWQ